MHKHDLNKVNSILKENMAGGIQLSKEKKF